MKQTKVAAIRAGGKPIRSGGLRWAIAFLLITILCYAQKPQSRLTNQDVIDLVSLGFSDEVVIDKIHVTDGAELRRAF
jgi:hypothetical protein